MIPSYIMWVISFIVYILRRGGVTWIDYWNQVLCKILSSHMPAKDPPDIIRSRTKHYHERKILLLLGLMDVSTKSSGFTNIYLGGYKMMNMKLSKSRGKDFKLDI